MILALRKLRMTAAEIAETLTMPLSTVSVLLRRNGVGRLGRIEGGAGKRVGGRRLGAYRGARTDLNGKRRGTIGWEYVHVAVDDHSRLAYVEVLPDERAATAIGFLHRALALLRPLRHYRRTRTHR
jgi:hypothetical protein